MRKPRLAPDEPFRLAALRRINTLDTPLEERFERITRMATRLFGAPIAAISLVDADRQWFKSIQGLSVAETSRDISFCGHTILQEDVMIVPDARCDVRFAENPLVQGDPSIVFYAGCPLRTSDGSTVGSLCLIDHEPKELTPEDLRLLRDLAAMVEAEIVTTVASASQVDLIEGVTASVRRTMLDQLTRLWNRKGIFEVLRRQLEHARAVDGGCAVILADIDGFTAVNSTWGQAAGDEVLRQVARRMLGAVRETDAVGRYIGDGFMAVCGGLYDPSAMTAVAERLRACLDESPVHTDAGAIPVTASVGIACYPARAIESPDEMLRAADAALERAKRDGRNRVELFGGEDASQAA
jgi:diguanylate cyclase (GGDEF)-like protein